jgi:DNA repair protein RecO (recombination protein O)
LILRDLNVHRNLPDGRAAGKRDLMGQNLLVTGMVLNAMPIGEYDKRITILTKERGKITAFARGARRTNSSLLAATDPFSFGEFEMFEGRSSYTVVKASIQNYFREVTSDYLNTYTGFYFLEFAEYFCQENSDEREMLKLLYQSLRALLSPSLDNRLVRVIFECKALYLNGIGPNIFSCQHCGKKEKLESFSVKRGGIFCDDCGDKADDAVKLSGSAVYALQYIASSDIRKLYQFTVTESVLNELLRLTADYKARYIGHSFKSLKVLEEDFNIEINRRK